MNAWIVFKELRAKLDFAAVLRHYGVEVKLKGAQHVGFCPLPSHNGKRNSPSFSANMDKKAFQCFGCGAKGNVLSFSVYMEKKNPEDVRDLRTVALGLQKRFQSDKKVRQPPHSRSEPQRKPEKPNQTDLKQVKEIVINPPLDFELKDLDATHPYLTERNLTAETIEHFGLGYCSRGYFKDRIVMPLKDSESRLIGYAGRIVDDRQIGENSPKYLFPGTRERAGKILEFRKGEFLYNGHAIKSAVEDLIIVEGFFSVHWLYQCGFGNVVGLMGWTCSEKQSELIVSHVKTGGRVWILSDGDDSGQKCAMNLFQLVASHCSVRWLRLHDHRQPTDCAKQEIQELLLG